MTLSAFCSTDETGAKITDEVAPRHLNMVQKGMEVGGNSSIAQQQNILEHIFGHRVMCLIIRAGE